MTDRGMFALRSHFTGAMTGYIYDASGNRVAKGTLSVFNCQLPTGSQAGNGFTLTNSYVLGLGGEEVSELTISGTTATWAHSNVFGGGKLLATYNSAGMYFSLNDWLGTKRAEMGTAPYGCASMYFSLAFGNGLAPSGNCPTDATEQHFTGKERDTESGNDYFGARYYASNMGRFMSPDWSAKEEPVPYGHLDNPQSLNLYGYVLNNPESSVDADGHESLADELRRLRSDLANAVKHLTYTAEVGVGLKAESKSAPAGGHAGGTVHVEVKMSRAGTKVTEKAEIDAGVRIGPVEHGFEAGIKQVLKDESGDKGKLIPYFDPGKNSMGPLDVGSGHGEISGGGSVYTPDGGIGGTYTAKSDDFTNIKNDINSVISTVANFGKEPE
jgi:RHS repeat-associated protein